MSNTPELPRDLLTRGFRLIVRDDGQMFAVSVNHGCSLVCRDLAAVIRSARAIAHWCEQQERRYGQ